MGAHRFKMFLMVFIISVSLTHCDATVEEAGVKVVPYTGPEITSELSQRLGQWSATVENGQVRLDLIDVESGELHNRLILLDIPGSMPAFASFAHYSDDGIYSLRAGTISIQNWEVNGVISGRIEGELFRPPIHTLGLIDSIFWIDLRPRQTGAHATYAH